MVRRLRQSAATLNRASANGYVPAFRSIEWRRSPESLRGLRREYPPGYGSPIQCHAIAPRYQEWSRLSRRPPSWPSPDRDRGRFPAPCESEDPATARLVATDGQYVFRCNGHAMPCRIRSRESSIRSSLRHRHWQRVGAASIGDRCTNCECQHRSAARRGMSLHQ